ncbi:CadD family cadmium resistance transporter [Tissierella creatinophila]|jgi:cadmium resistance transport/sequestration family protein|uniref:Cadmium resistance transporter n=1 Tax=Tissierella creatinophila DSM 6911 TaxID=1123403 RepID=A0A1U7M2U8_TISCR|nr:CadD family cadmium resistance transporter [Tissierella creatinophila]MDO9592691.1 CadD family cadmium resistance transporter [Erysipelotrichaceae bacterium]OLS01606.1 cadmium resistance transporter [Tissierella creatinophila DSM 6911]
MQTLISALLVFISTSIDYLVVLIILFANQGTRGIKSIYIGQYLGTGILVGVSLIAAYFLNYIPQDLMIGFLGLIPLGLGIRSIFVDEDVDEDSIGNQIKNNQSQIFAITGLTLAMGGDNLGIYIPYFTGMNVGQIVIVLAVFIIGIFLLCQLAKRFATIPMIGGIIERYGRIIVPVIFIGLGIYILVENGTINYLISFYN